MDIQAGYAHVNGTKIYFELTGQGAPLVLIHGGLGLDHRMWEPQWHVLAEHFQLIRYDLRGCGKSDVPTEQSYFHEEDLKALLDYLEIEKAHVAGLSAGAVVAIDFAATYPEATLSLISVDGGPDGTKLTDIEFWQAVGAVRNEIVSGGIEANKHRMLTTPIFASAMQDPGNNKLLTEIISDYTGWHWENNKLTNTPHTPPTIERLEEIRAQTLVIVGEHDSGDFHRAATMMEQRIPNSRMVILPNAGHMANMENAGAFNQEILQFLTRLDGLES